MTEQEAIKEVKRWTSILMSAGSKCVSDTAEAQDMAINALEEIQQYRAIGTPEECRAAVEKQKAKKPPVVNRPSIFVKVPVCPNCSTSEHYQPLYGKTKYCSNCGQKLDWSDSN